MFEFLTKLFSTSDFPARWHCGNWSTAHGLTHIVSDFAIAGAYAAIPILLGYFVLRRRDVPFPPIFWLFGAFILFCGLGHFLEAFIFWHPWYRLSAIVKACTAVASWATVLALLPVLPKALALPSLAAVNERLEAEVLERRAAESRLQETYAALKHANGSLERSNMELQQFAYVASHDLQTPLRGIAGFAHFLEADYKDRLDNKAKEYIERVVQGTERMQHLINDLLAFSRVESSGAKLAPISLNDAFDDAVQMLDASIVDTGAEVTRGELPVVEADRSQLAQLFQNLIGNGIKYHGDLPPRTHVQAERKVDGWKIAVSDNGIGIAPEYQVKIFEIFRRLHTQKAYPGTGIGLAISQRIVHRHGGCIWVESEEGKGSTFHFTIPDPPGATGAHDETEAA